MNFKQAIISGFQNYVTFSGRAPRSEYWYWVLFVFLTSFVLGVIDATLFGTTPESASPISGLFSLATLLPGLAITARRLHDNNRSGWWMLIAFTVIGLIPLIIWYCTKGDAGDNRFGADPLGNQPAPPALPPQSVAS